MKTYQHAMIIAYALEFIKDQGWEGKVIFDEENNTFKISDTIEARKLSDGKDEITVGEVISACSKVNHDLGYELFYYDKDNSRFVFNADMLVDGNFSVKNSIELPQWEEFSPAPTEQ